jgi:glycosyltransferase involved in cell wall biosynthesis
MPLKNEPLRILHLRSSSGFFGAEAVISTYFNALAGSDLKMELALLTGLAAHPMSQRLAAPVHIVPATGGFSRAVLQQLVQIVRNGSFDIIHSHDYKSDVYNLLLAKRSIYSVTTVHGWTKSDAKARFYEWLDCRLFRFFKQVITVSPALQQQLLRLGVAPDRCSLIANAVDSARFSERAVPLAPDRCRLVSVARLAPEKAQHLLIQAMAALPSHVDLTLIGDGPLREALESQTRNLRLEKRIDFLGNRNDIPGLLALMDVFVLPSLREGTPVALLEGMAAGCAAVASSVGGIPEILDHGQAGVLVPPGDCDALTAALMRLTADPARITELGCKAKRQVREHYGLQGLAASLMSVYSRRLAHSGS